MNFDEDHRDAAGGGAGGRLRLRARVLRRVHAHRHEAPTSCGRRSPTSASSPSTSPRPTAAGAAGSPSSPIVCEELAAAGLPVVADPRLRRDLRRARRRSSAPRSSAAPGCPRSPPATKMAFAITEPDAGSNSHHLATTATRDGEMLATPRHEDVHLRQSTRRLAILVVARTGTRRRR